MAGKPHTEETKRKISAAKKGRPGIPGFLGKKHTEYSKAMMSATRKALWARKRGEYEQ